jgi:RNA polymerase sigma-70 factor (ECF subfamily)
MTPLERNCPRPAAARALSREALGELLELHRAYLFQIAHEDLDPKLATKGDAADLVQETFLEAYRDFGGFRGTSEADLRAWLRRLLMNNLTNFSRRFRDGGKRALDREVSLDAGDPRRTTLALASDDSTPSGHVAAEEQAQEVRHALQRLPEDYCRVLQLRYREMRPFKEIARLMRRTPNATRKLWSRALARLRGLLGGPA